MSLHHVTKLERFITKHNRIPDHHKPIVPSKAMQTRFNEAEIIDYELKVAQMKYLAEADKIMKREAKEAESRRKQDEKEAKARIKQEEKEAKARAKQEEKEAKARAKQGEKEA